MNLEPFCDIGMVVTASSNEAEVMFHEQRFNSIFDEIAPSGGCGVQHLPEGIAGMPLAQEDFKGYTPCC
jgi:hypothetical protein